MNQDVVDYYQELHCSLSEVHGEMCSLGAYLESISERLRKIELFVEDLLQKHMAQG